jgi:hypothetical protein
MVNAELYDPRGFDPFLDLTKKEIVPHCVEV